MSRIIIMLMIGPRMGTKLTREIMVVEKRNVPPDQYTTSSRNQFWNEYIPAYS